MINSTATSRVITKSRALTGALTGALLCAPAAWGQRPLVGYTTESAEQERSLETEVVTLVSASRAAKLSKELSLMPHMAGTPAQARTRDIFARVLREAGITPEIRTYTVYMPHPTGVHLYRVAPDSVELQLAEGPVPGDTTSSAYPQIPVFNGYGAAGDVAGEVVYVNYGLIEDYKTLDSLGISVRGKVVIARYGKSYRGIKAREAEKHGAAALIIYSDPADDGYTRGDVYPEGRMRPEQGVQRGSVYNDNGDPTTPGYSSVDGARRVSPSTTLLPRIPVIPTSYRNATALLRDMRGGGELPKGWQGGLPFHYHVGPGPVRARVTVTTDASTTPWKQIWDVLGTIRGSEHPEELVIIGGHRDSWGPGAADNVSGTVSVLETARAIGELVKRGIRPKRTIVFASWDAEEWGLIGSVEYVEQEAERLSGHGVAYLNQDMVAFGSALGAAGAPSLRPFFREVTKAVRTPDGSESVYEAWRKASHLEADTLEPDMDDPGGGSDFAGFYNHLGIPIAEWGFGDAQGIYHSAYDSYAWLSKFGDPGFKYHATSAAIGATMLLRLANADVIPYDYVAYGKAMHTLANAVAKTLTTRGWSSVSVEPLTSAITRMESAARAFQGARDSSLVASTTGASRKQANSLLLQVERAFVRPQGLRSRAWYRNVIYAADNDDGYATLSLPSINEAIRAGDQELTTREIKDLAGRFDAAARILENAAQSLR